MLAIAAFSATACGGDDEDGGADSGESRAEVKIEIASPENGDTLEAGDIEVSVEVGGYEVVDKLGEDPVAGEGHVHFYIDPGEIPTAPGQPAVTEENTYHAEATTSFTWEGVRPGSHTFAVQLVNNNHTPLEPPVTDEATVIVE